MKKYLLNKREHYKHLVEKNFERIQFYNEELRKGGNHYGYNIDRLNSVEKQYKKNSKKANIYSKICDLLRLEIVEVKYEAYFDKTVITIKGTSEADIEKRVKKIENKSWIKLRKVSDD